MLPTHMFGLYRRWRRRRLLRQEFPPEWLPILEARLPCYPRLGPELRARLRDRIQVFVDEKYFIGAGGMEITDEVRVVIAGVAARLILYLDHSYYDRLTEIIVYPGHFVRPKGDGVLLGEAHSWGTVVLSWQAVLAGLADPCDGHDTAAHELAHVLDRRAGAFDGTPTLRARGDYRPWAEAMGRNFLALRGGGRAQLKALREYGAKDEAEFFAVATEAFFERPSVMQERTPDLYEVLRRFYGFDAASEDWCDPVPILPAHVTDP